MNILPNYENIEIDPNGEYWFNLCDSDKAEAFKEKYPNATIYLYGIDMANGSDTTFKGNVQVSWDAGSFDNPDNEIITAHDVIL